MKWSSSTISPTLTKKGIDLKLGARGALQSNLSATPPQSSVISAPVFAPDFLKSAINDLNDSQVLQSGMQSDWRASLLQAINSGQANLIPALTAASVAPGAKFSWMGGGGPANPVKPQPSYWEQKLAMKDLTAATKDFSNAQTQSQMLKQSTSPLWSFADRNAQLSSYQADASDAARRIDLANKTLGGSTTLSDRLAALKARQDSVNSGW